MATAKTHHATKGAFNAADINNPILDMFSNFRDELDEHHDRRERVIKASRDITALSKKMIFTLQRARKLLAPLPASLDKEYQTRHAQVQALFSSIAPDLQDLNAHRYARQISGGIQEYIEALSFHHYLLTGSLIPLASVRDNVRNLIEITPADYILGIFDLVGEIMRFGITMIATRGDVSKLLRDIRELRMQFETLDTSVGGGGLLGKEVSKKMGVMQTCVEKVEMAVCGFIVRGSERPKGWVPELTTERAVGGGRRGNFDEDEET
ncbi:Translin family-domain-containing protein [Morchella snyderi]|nr:Translin family-domain-containing protein [Morchella snyderi]